MLEKKLNACRYYTPPPEIQHLRKHFDDLPEIVRRAYYSVGNYIVAIAILKTCQKQPVIMDRYVIGLGRMLGV
jgi:UMP-CMP kinase 2